METKISFKEYKKAYLNFTSIYGIEGPLSVDTINTIMYYMNSEYLDEAATKRILDMEYLSQDDVSSDYITKAVEQITRYNTNSYYKGQDSIKLSDAAVLENQKQVIKYIEDLMSKICELPQEEAANAYNELKDIIIHKRMQEYNELSYKQQKLIETIDFAVATTLEDSRKNAKLYTKVA